MNSAVTNSSSSWGVVSRVFHWGTLALIVVQIPLGFWMVEVYEIYAQTYADDTWVMRTSRAHHTIGFFVLLVALARLTWRQLNTVPELPEKIHGYQRVLAKVTHFTLYALILIYPLSGWACLSAYEGDFPIFFLGWDNVPRVVPQVAEDAVFNYEFFAIIHRWCWRIGALVLGLHIAAALWHQLVARDGILRRMWSGSAD